MIFSINPLIHKRLRLIKRQKDRPKNKLSKKLNRLLQKKKHVVLLRVKRIRIPFRPLKKKLLVRIR